MGNPAMVLVFCLCKIFQKQNYSKERESENFCKILNVYKSIVDLEGSGFNCFY